MLFAFRSYGMVTKLSQKCSVPDIVAEGVIGFFDSNKKRQWVHHPSNLQLTYARVEYDTFCTFLSEAFQNLTDEHHYSPELHRALCGVAGLVVPSLSEEYDYEYDYDGPHELTLDSQPKMWGSFIAAALERSYGWGFRYLGEASQREFEKRQTGWDMLKLWGGRYAMGFEGTGGKAKASDFPKKAVVFLRGDDEKVSLDKDAHTRPPSLKTSSASSSQVGERKRKCEEEVWPPPSQVDIDTCTQLYTRAGRESFPLPKNTHVVIGYHVKNRNQFLAYCQRCSVWMDWPPATNKPRNEVCSCEYIRK